MQVKTDRARLVIISPMNLALTLLAILTALQLAVAVMAITCRRAHLGNSA